MFGKNVIARRADQCRSNLCTEIASASNIAPRNDNSRGFTLLEVVFTLTLIVFLISSVLFVYIITFRSSYYLGNRTDVTKKLHFALERMVRDLRAASTVSTSDNAVTFTLAGVSYYYYLHNSSGAWVPPDPQTFNQPTYDLRRAAVSDFDYGDGDLIVTGLDAPSSTTMTSSGNVAQITFSVTNENEPLPIKVSGYVRPRNA